jgi:hypothetical protein
MRSLLLPRFSRKFSSTRLLFRLSIVISGSQRGNWLGTAVRKTWLLAFAAAALLCLAGWCLEMLAPGAHSIGPAIEKLLHS